MRLQTQNCTTSRQKVHVVWPLLDFQSAVEDHLQRVYIIRGKDLMDSTRKQTLLYEHFGWTYPETMYWGRVKVHEWGGFSTSQMRSDIESGLTTDGMTKITNLAGLRKRGTQAKALRNFWMELSILKRTYPSPWQPCIRTTRKSLMTKHHVWLSCATLLILPWKATILTT